jgi:serine/threonine protein kinase
MGLEGRYTVVKKVADGGMAEIFLAHLTGAEGFARAVILKRILPVFSADPHFRNMIVDEAHIAMSLHHSNIVQVLDLGEARGRYFLVLELVDGWDLATVISRARDAQMPIPPGLCLYITTQVCRALAYAHGQSRNGKPLGIVHRDISPQNVLVSDEGEVKLTDFGIAKALGKRERTQAGVIKGKLDFMSPEQAMGSVLDPRSDIFSVGTLLYLLITGRRPFEADGQLETLIRVQNAQFVPPEQTGETVSPKIAAVIKRAMQKPPSERYSSAEEMMRDVEEILRGEFGSVGQSELKSYLEKLGRKDHVPPISRGAGLPHGSDDEGDDEIVERARPEGLDSARHTLAIGQTPSPTLAAEASHLRPSRDVARAVTGAVGVGRGGSVSGATRIGSQSGVDARMNPITGGPLGPGAQPGSLPVSNQPDDSTDYVPREPPRRWGLVLPAVVFVVLAGVGGTLYLLSPQAGRRLIDEGRERLARTGLPVPGQSDKGAGGRPARERDTATPPRAPERASEVPRPDEPAARTPRPALVTLRLISHPSGALVRNRNGAVVGVTPMSLSLKPGTGQKFTFSKRGYASTSRKLTVGDASETVSIDLTRASARRPRRR